ncbi:MAG TPA: hypothetical protein VGK87_04430 [Anaerolineae bacterium]|jgi:hypothetical protein
MTTLTILSKSINHIFAQTLTGLRKLVLRTETGSMDGGNTSDIEYIPFLIGLLFFGLMISLVGFYRVGASYATQFSSQVGSVLPDQGNDALAAIWIAWTGANAPANGFTQDTTARTVNTSMSTTKSFNLGVLGTYDFDISSGSGLTIRNERFYPGQPVCTETICHE